MRMAEWVLNIDIRLKDGSARAMLCAAKVLIASR